MMTFDMRPVQSCAGFADKRSWRKIATSTTPFGATVWDLPPLILHPFNERVPPSALLDNSKAALMLSGLIPPDGTAEEELQRRLLAGRYGEVRMLFFLGKDVFRWVEQCVEWAQRTPALVQARLCPQSFVSLLTAAPPPLVKEKLVRWGVADHGSIFSRAIGLNVLFAQPPAFDGVSEEFLRNYHRYADALYRCYLALQPHRPLTSADFQFELYASGEYSRILESKWASE
jgi:hypothetical protein